MDSLVWTARRTRHPSGAQERSEFITHDVIAGFDSNYPSAFGRTIPRLGHGPVLIKYTGQGSKKGSNAA